MLFLHLENKPKTYLGLKVVWFVRMMGITTLFSHYSILFMLPPIWKKKKTTKIFTEIQNLDITKLAAFHC